MSVRHGIILCSIMLFMAIVVAVAQVVHAQAPQPAAKSYVAEFVNCYDGDTCTFHIILETREEYPGMGVVTVTATWLRDQQFRLCDVDAPEIRPLVTREAGTRSRDALIGWIRAAKKLELKVPQFVDCSLGSPAGIASCDRQEKYGRWLAWIYADGVSLNQRLVQEGLAVAYMSCQTN